MIAAYYSFIDLNEIGYAGSRSCVFVTIDPIHFLAGYRKRRNIAVL